MVRKTAVITAASIAGVVLAGGAAVGANIGILNAADTDDLGSLSADASVTTPVETMPDPSLLPSDTIAGADTQDFVVEAAGTVTIRTTDAGLRLADVLPVPGWTWEATSDGPDVVAGTFRSGTDALSFVAVRNPDGSIDASVERPNGAATPGSLTTSPAATASTSTAPGTTVRHAGDDDDFDDHDSEDDDEFDDSDDDHDDDSGDDSDDDSDDDHDDDSDDDSDDDHDDNSGSGESHEGHDDDD